MQGTLSPHAAISVETLAQQRRRAIIATVLGNGLEWFDFTVYSFFAVIISKLFFPTPPVPRYRCCSLWRPSASASSCVRWAASCSASPTGRPQGGALAHHPADGVRHRDHRPLRRPTNRSASRRRC